MAMTYTRDAPIRGQGTTNAEAVQASGCSTLQRSMQAAMFAACHYLKVLRTVISTVVVDVMDYLVVSQKAANLRLSDQAMLEHMWMAGGCRRMVRCIDHSVSIAMHRFPALPCTAIFRIARHEQRVPVAKSQRNTLDPAFSSVSSWRKPRLFATSALAGTIRNRWGILAGHSGLLSRVWGVVPRAVPPAPGLHRASILPSTSQKVVW